MDSLGTAISVALQYGVPVESLVTKFTHQRFEPAGMSHNPDIPFAKSLVDYIFRWLGMEFVPGYREANAPKRSKPVSDQKQAGSGQPTPAAAKARAVASGETSHGSAAKGNGNGNGNGHAGSNGSGNGEAASRPETPAKSPGTSDRSIVDEPRRAQSTEPAGGSGPARQAQAGGEPKADTLTAAMKDMQSDAPACDVCGTITVRSGTCYKCMNCGNSMGCS
jgi:ribonucleoside-diphosphate reductase alpha chain